MLQEVGQMFSLRGDETRTRFAQGSQLPSIIVIATPGAVKCFSARPNCSQIMRHVDLLGEIPVVGISSYVVGASTVETILDCTNVFGYRVFGGSRLLAPLPCF